MKFGKNILAQQQRLPHFRYIDYKALKKIIKESETTEHLFAIFEWQLSQEISDVNRHFEAESSRILSETAVDDISGQVLTPLIVAAIHDIDILRKYAVWNAVAVVKILKKRRKKLLSMNGVHHFGSNLATERQTWLEREVFYNGQDFATLQAAVESLAQQFIGISPNSCNKRGENCPICMQPRTDSIELPCGHTFCWKCFVLGPICHANQEYRITKCPICREDSAGNPVKAETMLSRFLSTYFPGMGKEQLEGYGGNDVSKDLMRMVMVMQEGKDDCFFNVVHNQPREITDTVGEQKRAQQLSWIALASNPIAFSYRSTFCMLCCEPLDSEAIRILPCKHVFHDICLRRGAPKACPLCNASIPLDDRRSEDSRAHLENRCPSSCSSADDGKESRLPAAKVEIDDDLEVSALVFGFGGAMPSFL